MVTATVLDDELTAAWAFLHHIALHQLDVYLSGSRLARIIIIERPLVFADEAHDGVETAVAETHATTLWTLYLYFCWVEYIGLQATPESEVTFQVLHQLVSCTGVQPQGCRSRFLATRANAAHTSTLVAPASREVGDSQVRPAILARSMVAIGVGKQC